MDFTKMIYIAMAVLCLYSLVGFRGNGIFALKRAGSELKRQANRLKDRDMAQHIRGELLSGGFGTEEEPIRFRNKTLREAMNGYCVDIKRLSLSGESKYQRDIENYIHMDLLEHLGNSVFVEYACSGLTGLGILGTFIGMTQGLTGFNAQNASNALQSIATLTAGMQYAFTTSIVGIVLSLLLGVLHKCVRYGSERELNRFLDAFRENILSDQHEAGYNQVLSHLSYISQRLNSKVDNEVEKLEAIANRFVSHLEEKLELNIDAMRQSMEQVNAQQEIYAASVKAFSQQVGLVNQDIQAISTSFAQIVAQSEKLTKNLEQAGTSIGGGIEKLRQMVEADSEILENNRQLSVQLQESSKELAELVSNVNTQSLNTADVVRKLADYTASAVNETAAGCNKLVEMHYGELKNRMMTLMNVTEAQAAQVRDESIAQLAQIRQENARIKEEICHEGAQILGAVRQENQRIVEEVRSNSKAAIHTVSMKAQEVVLEMPQTRILREELNSIVESQNAIVRQLNKRNSLFAKMLQSLRRDAQ